jgi:hypothetical protein
MYTVVVSGGGGDRKRGYKGLTQRVLAEVS